MTLCCILNRISRFSLVNDECIKRLSVVLLSIQQIKNPTNCSGISGFMVPRNVFKDIELHSPTVHACSFKNFQNLTRARISRNALAFTRFPIHIHRARRWIQSKTKWLQAASCKGSDGEIKTDWLNKQPITLLFSSEFILKEFFSSGYSVRILYSIKSKTSIRTDFLSLCYRSIGTCY